MDPSSLSCIANQPTVERQSLFQFPRHSEIFSFRQLSWMADGDLAILWLARWTTSQTLVRWISFIASSICETLSHGSDKFIFVSVCAICMRSSIDSVTSFCTHKRKEKDKWRRRATKITTLFGIQKRTGTEIEHHYEDVNAANKHFVIRFAKINIEYNECFMNGKWSRQPFFFVQLLQFATNWRRQMNIDKVQTHLKILFVFGCVPNVAKSLSLETEN